MGSELVIYKSSAGSGKTYTLVLEYLKRVLKNPYLYKSILAITFTNKATEEMKTRIVDSLMNIAGDKSKDLQTAISEQTGIAQPELPAKAAKVLELILHDYTRFTISTIDSFFSKIVRSLARELHLSFRFDLQLDASSVKNEIVEKLFDDIGDDKELRQWLESYIFDKLDNDKGWALHKEIFDISGQLFSEQYRELFPEGGQIPDAEFISDLKKLKNKFENKLKSIGLEFLETIQNNNLTIDDFSNKSKGIAGYFSKITGKLVPEKYIPGANFYKALDDPGNWVTKGTAGRDEIIALVESKLMRMAEEINVILEKEFPLYTGAISVLNNAYMAGIIGKLDEKLNQYRTENDVVLISDNNLFLRKAIEGNDAHFIYEKSGNQFYHFMLDEFQDTSNFQWLNLYPLVQNALGTGNSIFIVGDAKQSIYRWRGGNMNLIQNEVQQQLKAFKNNTSVKNLDSNYRSRQVVVDFNNTFFNHAPHFIKEFTDEASVLHPYKSDEVTQQWKKGEPGQGYVQIKLFDNVDESVDESSGEVTENLLWYDSACLETMDVINNCVSAGYNYSDIAILVRKNADAKLITSFLVENGVSNIISPESMQLNRNQKIQFIINVLKFIDDYSDNLSLSHVAYYHLKITKQNNSVDLHEVFAAKTKTKLDYLPTDFSSRITEIKKMPLYEAVENLTVIFDLAITPDAYIQRFLDIILEFSSGNSANIYDFLIWWDDNMETDKCSVIVPSGVDAIRVMSIHKSKGLQFPIVIIPFADWDIYSDHKTSIWVNSNQPPFDKYFAHPVKFVKMLDNSIFKDEYQHEMTQSAIDNINLLYVALTRAEEQLYVFSKYLEPKKPVKEINTIEKLLPAIIKADSNWSTLFNENENKVLEIGNFASPYREEGDTTQPSSELTTWISNPWKERLRMVVNKQKIAISDPDLPELNYGIHFHSLAALIISDGPYSAILDNYISSNQLNPTTAEKLTNDIEVFIEMGRQYNWFVNDSETLNEIDLLLNDGTILRPDRLILKDNLATIIDYKTGVEEKWHAKQVQQYASALNLMGYQKTKMFLLYPSLKKVVEVEAA